MRPETLLVAAVLGMMIPTARIMMGISRETGMRITPFNGRKGRSGHMPAMRRTERAKGIARETKTKKPTRLK